MQHEYSYTHSTHDYNNSDCGTTKTCHIRIHCHRIFFKFQIFYFCMGGCLSFNQSRPGDTYGHQKNRPLLIQMVACYLFVKKPLSQLQYIPRNMHTVFALLCFVVVIHWLIFPYPSGLLHWHCGNLTIAPVPAKQPWWIWINTSFEFIMNGCITTTKQSTTKPCAYFLGYTVVFAHC